MCSLNSQKDLTVKFKKEVFLNTSILANVYPLPHDLSHIFKEDVLEKPTQHVFIHLSYYLVCIIDPQKASLITWPLFDTRAEKTYRNDLSRFIEDYHKLGLLTPVISSYFVNPGCFRVIKLLFQLSQLAVQRALKTKLSKPTQISLLEEMTKKYKECNTDEFLRVIKRETELLSSNFTNYIKKKKMVEEIVSDLYKKILENEKMLAKIKQQNLLDDLVRNFIKTQELPDETLKELKDIKNPYKEAPIFDQWLNETDSLITEMETQWSEKTSKFLKDTLSCQKISKTLISRHTGEADKKLYSIEYNHKNDEIDTTDLQNKCNDEQKYILKNLVHKEKLNFPNLVRAFLVAMSYVLNGVDVSEDISGLNLDLDCEAKKYEQVASALKALIDRVQYAEGKLFPQQSPCLNTSIYIKELSDIPPLPDLSDLKTVRDIPYQATFETFTPLNMSKHQFNLRRRIATNKSCNNIFVAPQPRSLVTPRHTIKDDFLKTISSCKVSTFDRTNKTQHRAAINEAVNRINDTIADCNTGFTKNQIQRLLSTRKGSTSKKNKISSIRPHFNVKRGGLYNDTVDQSLIRDQTMIRSYSSPDLFESKKDNRRKYVSVMQEDIPALLEVSGISIIKDNSKYDTPKNEIENEDLSRMNFHLANLADVTLISPVQYSDNNLGNDLLKIVDLDENITQKPSEEIDTKFNSPKTNLFQHKQIVEDVKTPATRPPRKSSSIEKIINRFKKVKASVLNETNNEASFSTIREEKENNLNAVNIAKFSGNKVILPDLLSPNFTLGRQNHDEVNPVTPNDILDNLCFEIEKKEGRKPRQSLGTALGVDQTFLDQFELID